MVENVNVVATQWDVYDIKPGCRMLHTPKFKQEWGNVGDNLITLSSCVSTSNIWILTFLMLPSILRVAHHHPGVS